MPFVQLVVVVVVIGLVLWLINSYVPMERNIKNILNVIIIVAVIVFVLNSIGVIGRVPWIRFR